jgi:RND superfamily putative drug exporter
VPKVGSPDPTETGFWSKVAHGVGRRPGTVLALAVVLLAIFSAGLLKLEVGLDQSEQFRTRVPSIDAQETLARHFPAGAAQPVTVITSASAADDAAAALRAVPGVAAVLPPEKSTDGSLVQFSVQLTNASGTPGADRTVEEMRKNPDLLVGGAPASELDQRKASERDDRVIIPLVLAVVLIVLVALLRSIVAPLLLLVTVVVSYAASLGAATLVIDGPLDANVPLLSFLFLVALGVDYNIFLVTRARDEGILRALAATGGVITSAGILLAAVFAVLGVLPVVVLTQIGIVVGIGVLVDTLLVRTVVVPALALKLGNRFWWPAKHNAPPEGTAPTAPKEPAHAHRG